MGELLDRAFQRRLLSDLRDLYPKPVDIQRSWGQQDDNKLLVNLCYLNEHGLIDLKATAVLSGDIHMHSAKITASGMDFITDDGGLTAILGVVTVKLHEETIKEILLKQVAAAEIDGSIKASLIKKIKQLPSEALGKITERALDYGLENIPDLGVSLQKWIDP